MEVKKKGPSNGSCSSKKAPFFSSMFFGKEYPSTGNCRKQDLKAPLANSTFQPMHFAGFSRLVNDDMCVSRSRFASEKAQAFGDAM